MSAPTRPSSARTGGDWDAVADGLDRLGTAITMPFAEQLLAAIDLVPRDCLIDVGCGAGAMAIPAARRGADVLAIDRAPAMVARVRARAASAGLVRLRAEVMEAEALALDDDAVDVAVSLNGVSVVTDPVRGLREMLRVTRPGGRLLVAAYGAPARAEFLRYLAGAVHAVAGDDVFAAPTVAFRFADRRRFAGALASAGGRDVQVEAVTWPMAFASARHFWNVVTRANPTGARLAAALTRAQAVEAQEVLDGMFRERSGGVPTAVLHTEVNVATALA